MNTKTIIKFLKTKSIIILCSSVNLCISLIYYIYRAWRDISEVDTKKKDNKYRYIKILKSSPSSNSKLNNLKNKEI